jgi:hypothetical protein
MTCILFVGQEPETLDFSDPALTPGFDAAKINAGIAVAVDKIAERGWQGDIRRNYLATLRSPIRSTRTIMRSFG